MCPREKIPRCTVFIIFSILFPNSVLARIYNHFGSILGAFWSYFWTRFGPITLLFDTCSDLGCGIHFQTILDRYGVDVQNLGSALQRIWYMFVTISVPYRDYLRLIFLSVCFSFCFMSFIITHLLTLLKNIATPQHWNTYFSGMFANPAFFWNISLVLAAQGSKQLPFTFLLGCPPCYFFPVFEYLWILFAVGNESNQCLHGVEYLF